MSDRNERLDADEIEIGRRRGVRVLRVPPDDQSLNDRVRAATRKLLCADEIALASRDVGQ
jgi:hypothetical protein